MYVSQINNSTFGNAKSMIIKKVNNISEDIVSKSNISQISKNLNESKALKSNIKLERCFLQKKSNLSDLRYDDDYYYYDNESMSKEDEAKGVVIGMTMTNAFIGFVSAQVPFGDEVVLSSVEAAMGLKIVKGIYGFKFGDAVIKSIMLAVKAHIVGKVLSKSVSWIPGIGNFINAGVAGYTTKAFGYALVDECERIQSELDRGKKIDDILNGK